MTVRNWLTPLREKIVYITPDGKKINLHDPTQKAVLLMSGWGIPPIQKATTRGPFQQGRTPLTLRVPPRTIQLTIRHQRGCRTDYWTARQNLVDYLRYNRGELESPTPGKLRWYRADGTIRQVDVILTSGPDFVSRGYWDEFSIQDDLVFEADNPIIYDPTQVTDSHASISCTDTTDLTFPFSFTALNISFGITYCVYEEAMNITYTGNWLEYPVIRIGGPIRDPQLVHSGTGLKIAFENFSIGDSEEIVIDLTYSNKSAQVGTNSVLGYLTTDSSLGLFALQPDPIVANGVNTITFSARDTSASSYVVFEYYNRYISG